MLNKGFPVLFFLVLVHEIVCYSLGLGFLASGYQIIETFDSAISNSLENFQPVVNSVVLVTVHYCMTVDFTK